MGMSTIADICTAQGIKPIKPSDIQTYEKMKCDWYNANIGTLGGVNCPVCKNKGNIARLNDEGIQVISECNCMVKRRVMREMDASGLGDLLISSSFEKYEVTEAWQERAKSAAIKYAESEKPGWMYISGQSGSGKTMLCTAVCKRLMERGMRVKYLLWGGISQRLDALRFEEGYDNYISEIRGTEVLYIDDFLKTDSQKSGKPVRPSPAELKKAYTVINTRYLSNKITLLSSEHYLNELSDYDPALVGRIKERCGIYAMSIKRDANRDYRIKGGIKK